MTRTCVARSRGPVGLSTKPLMLGTRGGGATPRDCAGVPRPRVPLPLPPLLLLPPPLLLAALEASAAWKLNAGLCGCCGACRGCRTNAAARSREMSPSSGNTAYLHTARAQDLRPLVERLSALWCCFHKGEIRPAIRKRYRQIVVVENIGRVG